MSPAAAGPWRSASRWHRATTGLSAASAAHWRSAPLTSAAGAWTPGSLLGDLPPGVPGWHRLHLERRLDPGQWDAAGRALLGWGLQLGCGLGVATDADPLTPGAVALLRVGPIRAPVRVLAVRQEDDLVGFGYGTLAGHPECGEEAFWVQRRGAEVSAHVAALSRPGSGLTRVAGPFGRLAQRLAARRYLAVLAGVHRRP